MLKKLREKLKWIDPFTYIDLYVLPLVNPGKKEWISMVVYVISAFIFAFVIFNGLGFLLGTSSPMVIVVSSSMEQVLFRGDVVFLVGASGSQINAKEVSVDRALVDSLSVESYATTYCTLNSSNEEKLCRTFKKACPANYDTTSIVFENGDVIPVDTTGDIIVYNSNTLNEPIIHRVVTKINARDGVYLLTKGDNVCNSKIDQEAGISHGAIIAEEIEGKALFWIPKVGCLKLWIFDDLFSVLLTGRLPQNFSGFC